jgi:hypothetical protein
MGLRHSSRTQIGPSDPIKVIFIVVFGVLEEQCLVIKVKQLKQDYSISSNQLMGWEIDKELCVCQWVTLIPGTD